MVSPGWLSPRVTAALRWRFQMIARENEPLPAAQAGANADPSAPETDQSGLIIRRGRVKSSTIVRKQKTNWEAT